MATPHPPGDTGEVDRAIEDHRPADVDVRKSAAAALLKTFHVDMDNGAVWLGDRRMLVLQADWFLDLRRALVDALGYDGARAMLTRLGYVAGVRDAQHSMKLLPQFETAELLSTGGAFHALQGSARALRHSTEFDPACKHLHFEFFWRNAIEAEGLPIGPGAHHRDACWMEIGYASGFLSTCVGGDIIVREVECSAAGANVCRCIARYAHEWGDVSEDLRYLGTANSPSDPLSAPRHGIPAKTEPPAAASDVLADHGSQEGQGPFVGRSSALQTALQQARRVGQTTATVLVLGESGVGKSALARYVHDCSDRRDGPFVEVNCAAIPEGLLESELFGVERGAFTGAATSRTGRFEEASGGTLFLDEVGLLTPAAQGKLLRVLQSQKYERLGSNKTLQADVRLVAATNNDLASAVRAGTFRSDLFYRLNVFPITVPPLRARLGDLPLLVDHLVSRFCRTYNRPLRGITPEAYRALLHHDWPGNIRELENVIERAVILVDDDEPIDVYHLFTSDAGFERSGLHWLDEGGRLVGVDPPGGEQPPLARETPDESGHRPWYLEALEQPDHSLETLEQTVVMAALRAHHGSLVKAARHLGITRAQIVYRLNKWGIDPRLVGPGGS